MVIGMGGAFQVGNQQVQRPHSRICVWSIQRIVMRTVWRTMSEGQRQGLIGSVPGGMRSSRRVLSRG